MMTVRIDRSSRLLLALVGLVGAASLGSLGCSSSRSGGGSESDAATDQTSPDGTADDAQPSEAATSDAPAEGSPGPRDGGGDADAASAEASTDASAAGEAGDAGTACTPVDASVDDAAASAGQALATTYLCGSCHSSDLSGGLTIMGAYSKNLTPDPATGLGCWTDSQIVTAMLFGTTPDGQTLCVMPKWGTTGFHGMTLDGGQAESIVQYLRSVPAVSKVVPPTDCVALGFGGNGGADGGDAGDAAPTATDGGDAGDGATEQ